MARPREFNEAQVLDKAVQVFWARGYDGTHMSALMQATGLSKSSLYDTFGSKRALYLAALDRYIETTAATAAAQLIAGLDCPREGIAAVFDAFVENMTGRGVTRGCFVNNTAGEALPTDRETTSRLARAMGHLEGAFYEAVVAGQKLGRINAAKDPRALARTLTSSLNGLMVMGKTNPERAVLQEIADLSLTILD